MFPTTVWTTIREAGGDDRSALEAVAGAYRDPVLAFIRARGFREAEADDLCQEVFVRVLQGDVLAKADPARGRFRSLLLTVATRVMQDRWRRRPPEGAGDAAREAAVPAADFDRAWALHLAERALQRLRETGSPYYEVLDDHLHGRPQDRNRLWHARKKLSAEIRREIAWTCTDHADLEAELELLAPYLRS